MKAPAQKLPYPARQADMRLQPASELTSYRAAGKLGAKLRSSPAPTPASAGPWPSPSAYVLLDSPDGSFMTGALVHVTGGKLSSDE